MKALMPKKARDWRAKADEVFTFARYAKEDFDSDDLEKKRTVVVMLGEKLTILDRTIQFTPNKYLLPIEKINNTQSQLENMVRTENNDALKSKNNTVGVLAIPDQSMSFLDLNSSWLTLADALRTACLDFDKSNLNEIKAILATTA